MNNSSEHLARGYKAVIRYVVSGFTLKCAEYGYITDLRVSFTVQS
jgi:hypothetical protein